ncbi:hypothetical protein MVEN_00115500 [Mycena venus]|uniref:Uncharacterized protein n=1 Tax=Mycena venus TaxID=2733690 RepID=A0A8H6Z565_9AGAR|nr:hypothetical protein MVEN_00115500 [Mycena venus]
MHAFLVSSLVVLVSLTIPAVSATNAWLPHIPSFHTVPLPQPSSWQELATSHIYIPLILLASVLGRYIGSSFWSPPRGVSSSVVHGSFCSLPSPPTKTPPTPVDNPSSHSPPTSPSIPSYCTTSVQASFPDLDSSTPSPSHSPPSSPPTLSHRCASVQTSPPTPDPTSPPVVPVPPPPPPPPPEMPARSDPSAPAFDSQQPQTLARYFSDLAFLFSRSCITVHAEQKFFATRYLSHDDQELWECVPEFSDSAIPFVQFRTAIFRLYPDADPERRHSLGDLESLVKNFSNTPSPSHAVFLDFYRRFFTISSYLRSRDHLSIGEQSRLLFQAVPLAISPAVQLRLRIVCPGVHPHDPYALEDLRAAIDFVLVDMATTPSPFSEPHLSAAPGSTPLFTDPSIAALFEATNQLIELISSAQQLPFPASSRLDSQPPSSPRPPMLLVLL